MRDEKEERKKQARSNKQTRQSNTAHPRQSLFLEKNELPRVGLEPTTLNTLYSILYVNDIFGHFCTISSIKQLCKRQQQDNEFHKERTCMDEIHKVRFIRLFWALLYYHIVNRQTI